jgi:type I restriction enzyme R subunit
MASDIIVAQLIKAGWQIQNLDKMNFSAGLGIAIREYPTSTGPVDYALFIDNKPVGVIEAKPEEWGDKITNVEEQSSRYANSTLALKQNIIRKSP